MTLSEALAGFALGSLALERIFPAVLTFIVCLVVMRIVTVLSGKLLSKSKKLDDALRGFIRSAIKSSSGCSLPSSLPTLWAYPPLPLWPCSAWSVLR